MSKLRNKLLVWLLLPIISVLAGLSYFAYQRAEKSLAQEIERTSYYLTSYYGAEIRNKLMAREGCVEVLSRELAEKMPDSRAEMMTKLLAIAKADQGIMALYVAFPDRTLIGSDGFTPPPEYDPTSRGWYKEAVAAESAVYSDVYVDANTKQPIVSVSKAVRKNGKVVAVAAMDIELKDVVELTKTMKVAETGYGFLLSREGSYIYHPEFGREDKIAAVANGRYGKTAELVKQGQNVFCEVGNEIVALAPIGATGWNFGISVPVKEVYAPVRVLGEVTFLLSLGAILLLALLIIGAARSIAAPLAAITNNLSNMAKGDFSGKLDDKLLARNDEFGVMTNAFSLMAQNIRDVVAKILESSQRLSAAAQQLTESSRQSAQAAESVAEALSEVATGAQRQVTEIGDTGAALRSITFAMSKMNEEAEVVSGLADGSARASLIGQNALERAGLQMEEISCSTKVVEKAVGNLADSSGRISEIVSLISGLAGQTNLLALNAAIEAARAGEHGRGFAVVSEEVRKLAEQSEGAAKQIGELINESLASINAAVKAMADGGENVNEGSKVMKEVDGSFGEIVSFVGQVKSESGKMAEAVKSLLEDGSKVESAAERMEANVRNIAGQTHHISSATEQQTASAQEIAASSRILAQLAQEMQALVEKFRT